MSTAKDQLIDWVIGSLSVEPEEWTFDHYRAKHKSGLSIWISNSSYGCRIEAAGAAYGGVTMISTFFGWLTWRGRVMRAVEDAAVKKILAGRRS